jgi:hypothetical protein
LTIRAEIKADDEQNYVIRYQAPTIGSARFFIYESLAPAVPGLRSSELAFLPASTYWPRR